MIIEHKFDLTKLVDERIEAIEDLNCEELSRCIKAFIYAAWWLDSIEQQQINAMCSKKIHDFERDHFEITKNCAQDQLDIIDELTLRIDAAE